MGGGETFVEQYISCNEIEIVIATSVMNVTINYHKSVLALQYRSFVTSGHWLLVESGLSICLFRKLFVKFLNFRLNYLNLHSFCIAQWFEHYPGTCKVESSSFGGDLTVFAISLFFIICSPEPKAHGKLIVYQSSRRLYMRLCFCVFTFSNINISETSGSIATKFYLKHHWVGGKDALGFGLDRIRTCYH